MGGALPILSEANYNACLLPTPRSLFRRSSASLFPFLTALPIVCLFFFSFRLGPLHETNLLEYQARIQMVFWNSAKVLQMNNVKIYQSAYTLSDCVQDALTRFS